MFNWKILKRNTKGFFVGSMVVFIAAFSGCVAGKVAQQESAEADQTQQQQMAPESNASEEMQQASPNQPKLINSISAEENPESVIVSIKGNTLLTYTSVKQPTPLGLVLYFPETALEKSLAEVNVENDIIHSIKASEIIDGGPSKVTITLKKDAMPDIARDGNGLRILFHKISGDSSGKEKEDADTEAKENPEAIAQAVPAPAAMTSGTKLESVTAKAYGEGVDIKIKSDGAIKDYKAFTLDNPARIVVDLYKIKSSVKGQRTVQVDSKWVKKVRYYSHPDYTRIVLDTEREFFSAYSAKTIGDGLSIKVGKVLDEEPVKTPAAEAPKTDIPITPEETRETVTAEAVPPVAIEKEPSVSAVEKSLTEKQEVTVAKPEEAASSIKAEKEVEVIQKGTALVNQTDFSSEKDGKSTITIGTTRSVNFNIVKPRARELRLQLYDTKVPRSFKWPTITTRFDSAVDRIIPVYSPEMKDKSIFVIELREDVAYRSERVNDKILIHFDASAIKGRPYKNVDLPDWQKILNQTVREETKPQAALRLTPAAGTAAEKDNVSETAGKPETSEHEAVTPEAEKAMEEAKPKAAVFPRVPTIPAEEIVETDLEKEGTLAADSKVYTGEKISLDFYQTDIKNVLRILRDVSGRNFAVDKDVTGTVTLSLIKPVPWDQVLDLVLKMNQLSSIMEGDVVRITTQTTRIKEEQLRRDEIKATQSVTEEIKATEPLMTKYIPISYANASSDVKPHIEKILTDKRGSLSVDTRNNQIILTDIESVIKQAVEIVRMIDKVTPQVVIEARIVEVSDSFSRDLGTQWGMGEGVDPSATRSSYDWNVALNHAPAVNNGILTFNYNRIVGTPFSLNARLIAGESQGDSKIISTPKVVTLDNKTASITQGIEVPYQQSDGNGNTTTQFKNVDLKLDVTPHVTPDNRISLKLDIGKNDVIPGGGGSVPSLSTNSTKTELLVNDGDTIVIGGIVKTNTRTGEARLPLLGQIPVVGWLFKSKSWANENSELLIFITPTIVHLETHG